MTVTRHFPPVGFVLNLGGVNVCSRVTLCCKIMSDNTPFMTPMANTPTPQTLGMRPSAIRRVANLPYAERAGEKILRDS